MKPHTLEFMQLIENHPDPERAWRIALDLVARIKKGESWESIGASYSMTPEEIREMEARANG